jgi:hypothetical protein
MDSFPCAANGSEAAANAAPAPCTICLRDIDSVSLMLMRFTWFVQSTNAQAEVPFQEARSQIAKLTIE